MSIFCHVSPAAPAVATRQGSHNTFACPLPAACRCAKKWASWWTRTTRACCCRSSLSHLVGVGGQVWGVGGICADKDDQDALLQIFTKPLDRSLGRGLKPLLMESRCNAHDRCQHAVAIPGQMQHLQKPGRAIAASALHTGFLLATHLCMLNYGICILIPTLQVTGRLCSLRSLSASAA